MTLVMTLLARDEIDVVDAWLAFHLNAGVDLVIATDNLSQDGTTEVLEEYARSGHVHLIREPGEDLRQDEWVTRMARLAATQYSADWVINSDADEFWWPRGPSLSRGARRRPCSLRDGRAHSSASSVPPPGRRRLRRADDRPLLGARTDQRPGVAVQAHQEDHPPRPSRDPAHARQPRARGQPVRPASRLVPDRGASTSRSARWSSARTRRSSRARRSRSTSTVADRVPRADVRRAQRRAGSASITRRWSSTMTSCSAAWPMGGSSSTLG